MGWWKDMFKPFPKDDFQRCLEFVFKAEGYLSNDPLDRGGLTKYGISKTSHPDLNIEQLTKEQASVIYKHEYWQDGGCDKMLWPLNLIHFDACVNHGISNAYHILKKAEPANDVQKYAKNLINSRTEFFKAIVRHDASQGKFLKGWLNRLHNLGVECGLETE